MADSLALGGIELLGGGVASAIPGCEGAIFRLGRDYDLSAPQWTSEKVAGLLLAGEQLTSFRASNRTPKIPVVILVPSTGDPVADRLTLATAREVLLETAAQDQWHLTWTRDGGLPLVLDCQGVSATVVEYSLVRERALVSLVEIDCEAYPFGHSDVEEAINLTSPSSVFDLPPAPVTLDDFSAAVNFLQGDASGFEGGIAGWVAAGNCTIARSAAQFHTGTASLLLTATGAGNMQAASVSAALFDQGAMLRVNPGDTVNGRAFSRAATIARSVNIGVDFYDANGTQVGASLRGSNATNSTTVFTTQVTCAVTAPAGAAWARATPQVVSAAAGGEAHYFDDISLDRGVAYSADDGQAWSLSSQAPVVSGHSARWSRIWRDAPVYDHILAAPLDITGRTKIAFWVGLGTTQAQWPTWHRGRVHFAATLYDAAGQSVAATGRLLCQASALPTIPEWHYVALVIPQVPSGFDYTTVSRYVITAWNLFYPAPAQATGAPSGAVLQSGFFLGLVQAVATSVGSPVTRGLWAALPAPVGSAPAPLSLLATPGPSVIAATQEYSTAGTKSFTTPAGLTVLAKVEGIGGGGGGAGADGTPFGGGGGGGGEYSKRYNIPVTAATLYNPVVGAGGSGGSVGNPGQAGADTVFTGNSGQTMRAHGGNRGWVSQTWGGGKGGTGSTDDEHYSGGNGRQSNVNGLDGGRGGGGGASGGTGAAGQDADDFRPPAAVAGGGPGAYGGQLFVTPHSGQTPSKGPGGGGGGGAILGDGSKFAGAAGRDGWMKLTYGASGLLPLTSLLVHMPDPDAPAALNPLVPVGNGADTPNGATEYQVPDIGSLNARYDGTYTCWLVGTGTWGAGSSARTVTIQFRQYPYAGGTAVTQNLARTFTPTTDIVNGYVDMGQITLPLAALPPGNTDAYFALTVTSGQTADRYLDVLLISTEGTMILVNTAGVGWNSVWVDAPDRGRDLGLVAGSDADRSRAYSISQYVDRWPGGPFAVRPNAHNRILFYAAQGCPGALLTYLPNWLVDRLA